MLPNKMTDNLGQLDRYERMPPVPYINTMNARVTCVQPNPRLGGHVIARWNEERGRMETTAYGEREGWVSYEEFCGESAAEEGTYPHRAVAVCVMRRRGEPLPPWGPSDLHPKARAILAGLDVKTGRPISDEARALFGEERIAADQAERAREHVTHTEQRDAIREARIAGKKAGGRK